MLTGFPNLTPEVQHLVDQKKFDALGQLWTKKMEENAEDFPFFFDLAAAAKKKGGSTQAVGWLRSLADFHNVGGNESLIRVLLELARMSPTDASVRKDLTAALRARYAGHPALSAVIAQFPLEKAADPSEVAGRIARWLRFQPNAIYYMPGRGAGRLVDMNPALDVMRLEVAGNRMPLSLVSAEKNLVPLPEGHFLRRKVEDPAGLKALAESEPSEALRLLLTSFGRLADGAGGQGPLRGPRSGGALDALLDGRAQEPPGARRGQREVGQGDLERQRRRRRGQRAGGVPEGHARGARWTSRASTRSAPRSSRASSRQALAGDAQKVAPGAARRSPGSCRRPRRAWRPTSPRPFPPRRLLASADLRRVLGEIRDQGAREKALEAVRQSRPDWAEIFIEQIGREDDARVLTTLFDALGDRAADLSRKILRSPRSAPRAFVWLCERMHAEGKTDAPALFFALTDALRMDEFSGLRARMKEFFEPGGFGVALVRSAASEEEAREMLHALDRVPGLEEHRRATVREALLMKFPELRAPAREYLYATAESIEARRQEVIHLKSGRAAGQRRCDEDGQGARRPARELRVPRRAAEARVPLGAHRDDRRRAVALAGARPDEDRRVGSARRHARALARRRDRRRAGRDDPRALGLEARGRDLLLPVRVRRAPARLARRATA